MTVTLGSRRSSLSMVLIAAVFASMFVVAAPDVADAAVDTRAAERQMVRRINRARDRNGMRKLAVNLQARSVARDWAAHMRSRGTLAHNPNMGSDITGPWRRLGENVGYTRQSGAGRTALTRRLHRAFMNSSGHRANVLGNFNQVAVGVRMASDGTMWMTVNFVKGPKREFRIAGFTAQPQPRPAVTRARLAHLLVGASDDLHPRSRRRFADVPAGHKYRRDINAAVKAGVIKGCGKNRFCPRRKVTRKQMAGILVRASDDLRPVRGPRFRDLSWRASRNARAVVRADVMHRCATRKFCGKRTVKPAAAKTFVRRTFR